MNRFAITLGGLTVAAGAVLSSQATAATTNAYGETPASAACQGALPSYEGNFRKRPLAIVNQGSTSAFLSCAARSGENGNNALYLYVTNRAAVDTDVNCTLVDGLIGPTIEAGFANYYPQTLTVAAGSTNSFAWEDGYQFTSVSCNMPAGFELNILERNFDEEIGA